LVGHNEAQRLAKHHFNDF